MNKICCNCGATATCEHHIVPISCGGFDIASNKASLCDKCHGIVHGISTNKGNLSHSDLIKEGMKKKKESLEKEHFKAITHVNLISTVFICIRISFCLCCS
jgi:5-methylcytosine-specific restriction endonuclease McrA